MVIAVFAGCRYLVDHDHWHPPLDAVAEEHGITEVWHGACTLPRSSKLAGGDAIVDRWARLRGLEVKMFPAPWDIYRKAGIAVQRAGPRRQRDMLRGRRWYKVSTDADAEGEQRVVADGGGLGRVELMVALPGGPGTKGTMKQAAMAGIPALQLSMAYPPNTPRVINAHHYRWPTAQRDIKPDNRPALPEGAIYIGRSCTAYGMSALRNPHPVGPKATAADKERTLQAYRVHLWRMMKIGDANVLNALRDIKPDNCLVCYCKRQNGSGACHGDTVVAAWEWMRDRGAL